MKRITVNPGGKLSVQMHHHRAEHWVVVGHRARRSRPGDPGADGERVGLPPGGLRPLKFENRGKIPLELIEVQTGSYLGEDDIVRFEDQYGRIDSDGVSE